MHGKRRDLAVCGLRGVRATHLWQEDVIGYEPGDPLKFQVLDYDEKGCAGGSEEKRAEESRI